MVFFSLLLSVDEAPYGSWLSPITARMVASKALRLASVTIDGEDIYWLEGRPHEGTRQVVVRRGADGRIADATPAGTNVGSRVHEYGGAPYAVAGGTIYYSESADHRLYRLLPSGSPQPLTPSGAWRYADLAIDPSRYRLVCVREDHTLAGREPRSTLVSVPLAGSSSPGRALTCGYDFYSTPRFSPDYSQLSWLAWRHPDMPWDGTELWVATIDDDGTLVRAAHIAGSTRESIFQPEWAPDGTLFFVSDRSGWWNLYRFAQGRVVEVCPMAAEFGLPQWQLGARTWACAGARKLVVSYGQQARWHLGTIDLPAGTLAPIQMDLEPAGSVIATPTHAVLIASSAREGDAVVRVDLATGKAEQLRRACGATVPESWLSAPQAIEFPTDNGQRAQAFFYRPHNPRFVAPRGTRPPLIVMSHGGPTDTAYGRLNLEVQYWTSRGFAVVDVNYGGSAGFGRIYRQRLNGQWGIVDVADCVNAVRYLIAAAEVAPDRVIIRGRGAGAYTALAALASRPDVFRTGASDYGVADLEHLALNSHKFESRYLDRLVGPYPAMKDTYRRRTPIRLADRSTPMVFFSDFDEAMEPHLFESEQHRLRRVANLRCLDRELSFYGAVLGFAPAPSHRRTSRPGSILTCR